MDFNSEDSWEGAEAFLKSEFQWEKADPNNEGYIYTALVNDESWNIPLNDFPSEPMFSLIVSSATIIHFNEWPAEWGVSPKLG
jgi:hypothetical protein